MSVGTITATLWLDRRNELKDGTYSVRVEIYYFGKKKRIQTGVRLTEDEFDRVKTSERLRDRRLLEAKENMDRVLTRAKEIIGELGDNFTPEAFDLKFYSKVPKSHRRTVKLIQKTEQEKSEEEPNDVYAGFKRKYEELDSKKKFGSRDCYKTAMNSLKAVAPKLKYEDITPKFLEKYEERMRKNDMSYATVGIYLRSLRAVYNKSKYKYPKDDLRYPFGKKEDGRYTIPSGEGNTIPLDKDTITRIIEYTPVSDEDAWCRDMWLFSFYCNGMNMADIFKARYEDIEGEFFTFLRAKTIDTAKTKKPVQIYITPYIRAIIDRWGNPNKNPKNYIFGVYDESMDEFGQFEKKKNTIRKINESNKRMFKRLGIKEKVNTYVARHSWSNMLDERDVSVMYISQGLGHTSLKTTQHYLQGLKREKKIEVGNMIADILYGTG